MAPARIMRQRNTGRSRVAHLHTGMRGFVVSYSGAPECDPRSHEAVTLREIAQRVAALKGCEYAGEYDADGRYGAPLYFVPDDTLALDAARALGIAGEHDLFGGVVPYEFVGTKSITHPVFSERAHVPRGWSREFDRLVRNAVLPGFSAFASEDALAAGERLLARGPIRVKPSLAVGGRGQTIVRDSGTLAAALAGLDPADLARCGVVLEQNLEDVTTYSVGQVLVHDLVATYVGTQKLTPNGRGDEVYGGSDLTVARGGFDALLSLDIDDIARDAIRRSRVYDAAVGACFSGFFASRRNYDIARGRDADGQVHCGVLEQSWRIGGATPAEVAALEAFRGDRSLRAVRAECSERYGRAVQVPDGAIVHFQDDDPEVGFITKYATVERYVDA